MPLNSYKHGPCGELRIYYIAAMVLHHLSMESSSDVEDIFVQDAVKAIQVLERVEGGARSGKEAVTLYEVGKIMVRLLCNHQRVMMTDVF